MPKKSRATVPLRRRAGDRNDRYLEMRAAGLHNEPTWLAEDPTSTSNPQVFRLETLRLILHGHKQEIPVSKLGSGNGSGVGGWR